MYRMCMSNMNRVMYTIVHQINKEQMVIKDKDNLLHKDNIRTKHKTQPRTTKNKIAIIEHNAEIISPILERRKINIARNEKNEGTTD